MKTNVYEKNVKSFFNNEVKFLHSYWKARVGLYALLRAMNVKESDEVILPAFTCVVVPNAILYLGAKPVYVDINPETYNVDANRLEEAITDQTKVIICQNTYGLSTDLGQINKLAQENGLFTIEDCTHGFGGTYNDVPNGLSCDAAIYSTQWNKPFSTGIGGFVVAKDEKIAKSLSVLNEELVSPSVLELINLKFLYFVRRYLIKEYTYWTLVRFYRWLSSRNIVVGSSSGEEITSVEMPADYFKAFSRVQAKEGLRTLPKLKDDLVKRKETAECYTSFLKQLGKNHVDGGLFDNHSFLKYPLLVNQREEFMRLAEKNQIEMGDWFISPLHPVEGDLSPWKLDREKFPVANYISSHVVNLPTTPTDLDKVLTFLAKHSDFII